jgi:hypothetical protein
MNRPGDKEPEPSGGRAAERLKEFLRQRLPPDASPEEIQAESERLEKEEAERSQSPTHAEPPPQPPDPDIDNPK